MVEINSTPLTSNPVFKLGFDKDKIYTQKNQLSDKENYNFSGVYFNPKSTLKEIQNRADNSTQPSIKNMYNEIATAVKNNEIPEKDFVFIPHDMKLGDRVKFGVPTNEGELGKLSGAVSVRDIFDKEHEDTTLMHEFMHRALATNSALLNWKEKNNIDDYKEELIMAKMTMAYHPNLEEITWAKTKSIYKVDLRDKNNSNIVDKWINQIEEIATKELNKKNMSTNVGQQLNEQTKEILGETVVLGKGFEDTDADSKAYALGKRTGNQDDESFFDRVKDFFSPKPKEEEPLEVIQVPELKVTPAIPVKEDKQIDVPTGSINVVRKEKPDEIKFMYDADLIAKMIVTEAGDKDLNEEEMLAMASVVVNRANKKTGFSIGKGETRIEKLIRSGDFLGVTEFEDRFNNPRKTHEEKYVKALNIARDLLTGKVKDNTGGALYFNQDPMSGGKKYGEHYFYVNPYKAR